ncbi:MAG: carbohydrate ABC transporter permease [Christensenellales bacterium]|jgi:putative aldouronate transport system permease protein
MTSISKKHSLHKKNKIRQSLGSRIFDVFNVSFFILFAALIIFPFFNIIAISLTSNAEFMREPFIIWPKAPTFEAYNYLFSTPLIPRAYLVTLIVAAGGTGLAVLVTSMLAYGLSKKNMRGHKFFMIYLLITMFFSGGLIPNYINMTRVLGLSNNLLALILPSAVNVFNFIIIRSFFLQLPTSLEESAKIDGANDLVILFRIIYPLSIPTLATIAMFVAVGLWNSWFASMLYMRDEKLYTLQLIIRNYVVREARPADMQALEGLRDAAGNPIHLNETGLKMASAVASTLPMLGIYPFIQKYFEKGVTIGAIKG